MKPSPSDSEPPPAAPIGDSRPMPSWRRIRGQADSKMLFLTLFVLTNVLLALLISRLS